MLLKVYYHPLLEMGDDVVNQRTVKSIFAQIEVILNYNRQLLAKLQDRMDHWFSKGQCMGDIFLSMVCFSSLSYYLLLTRAFTLTIFFIYNIIQVVFLKVYTMYVNNYNTSLQLLLAAGSNAKFNAFLEVT